MHLRYCLEVYQSIGSKNTSLEKHNGFCGVILGDSQWERGWMSEATRGQEKWQKSSKLDVFVNC